MIKESENKLNKHIEDVNIRIKDIEDKIEEVKESGSLSSSFSSSEDGKRKH
jgi:predicted  nucleic acid-binding Zn-ribbon protein